MQINGLWGKVLLRSNKVRNMDILVRSSYKRTWNNNGNVSTAVTIVVLHTQVCVEVKVFAHLPLAQDVFFIELIKLPPSLSQNLKNNYICSNTLALLCK